MKNLRKELKQYFAEKLIFWALCLNPESVIDLTVPSGKITKKTMIKLNGQEIQSGLNRQRHAELLIKQLPNDHDGRNTWLLNYGYNKESRLKREKRGIKFDELTQSAETIKPINSK